MDISNRFSSDSLIEIRKILEDKKSKSIILKANFDENELIINPLFLSENKKKELNNIYSKFKRDEVYIRVAKGNELYPSDLELELAEELYNKKNVAFCILSNDLEDFYFVQDIDREILSEVDILPYFEKNGILSQKIDNFEYREEQKIMAQSIQKAINQNKKIIVEAGTGTGKTLAYLVPSIKWAIENQKKVIIATNTINLQEQLLNKDIPIVKLLMEQNFSYTLVKGRNNYVCKRLFAEISVKGNIDIDSFNTEQKEQLKYILAWGKKTENGDKSELPFEVNAEIWDLIQSSTELCIGRKCPYRTECFYMKTRRDKMEANILISNHHIFFADLNVRSNTDFDSEYLILPKYDVVIFDEAHNIESVARSYFSVEISKYSFTRLLNRIYTKSSSKKRQESALSKLETSIDKDKLGKESFYVNNLEKLKDSIIVLQGIGNDYFEEVRKVFDNGQEGGVKRTLNQLEMKKSNFLESTREKTKIFLDSLIELYDLLSAFNESLSEEKEKNPDVTNFLNHLNIFKTFIDNFKFINTLSDDEYIYWLDINSKRTNIVLTATPLNIAKRLSNSLFENLNRLIFASATISANGKFDYFKNSIGLNNEECIEKIIDSPFDYDKQMRVFIPTDIQNSESGRLFLDDVSIFLENLLNITGGKAFILFTSYSMLNYVYYSLRDKLRENNFQVFLHGDKSRTQLINEFKKSKNPILFGTSSFWEGVDVQGENLSNVIIVKLPFLVPTDPVVAAISKKIEENGKNPFIEFQLPEALIKFKQGIGRLIRNKNDKGNIFILDNRILKKFYGSLFLKSIPTKNIEIRTKKEIYKIIDEDN